MGEMAFSAQFQQQPVPLKGNLLKADWFQRYDRQPDIGDSDQVIQSWDVATTSNDNSDWSVCTTWLIKNKKHYLLHVSRERLTFPELKRKILRLAAHHRAKSVLIEEAGIGTTMVQLLKSEGVRVIGCAPKGCKITRMEGQSVLIESGSVLIPETAPWLGAYLTELLTFPSGRHDDRSIVRHSFWPGRTDRSRDPVSYSDASH
jgi:predicted phage terminase large subunit-like protein